MAIADYIKTIWANGSAPAINADNLNKIEDGIDVVTDEANLIDSRVTDLENGIPVESMEFIPQITTPTYTETLLWYDDNKKSLAYFDDVTTDPIHIGQEMLIHVYNDTGVTIPGGSAVRYAGAVIDGVPTIALAQADAILTASVLGISAVDMPTGTKGSIVTQGIITGADTSTYTLGEHMYLSAAVPGGITATPPEIISAVGGPLTIDANGDFYVKINNFLRLPYAMASMSGGSGPATVDGTWSDIANYTTSETVIMTNNITTGEILSPQAGLYTVTANIVVSFDDIGATTAFFYVRMIGDGGFVGASIPYSVARNGEGASVYPSVTSTLPVGQNYKMQVSANATLTNVVYEFVSFSLESKKLIPSTTI